MENPTYSLGVSVIEDENTSLGKSRKKQDVKSTFSFPHDNLSVRLYRRQN